MTARPQFQVDPIIDTDRVLDMSGRGRWQLDRHFNLSIVGAIILQSAIAIWWVATFSAAISGRVEVLEQKVAAAAPISERLVRLETKFDAAVDTLQEIKAILRQGPPRASP